MRIQRGCCFFRLWTLVSTPADHPSKVDLTRWYIDLLHDQILSQTTAPRYAKTDYGFANESAGKKEGGSDHRCQLWIGI